MAKKTLKEINELIAGCGKDTAKAIEIAEKYKKTIGDSRFEFLMKILTDKKATEDTLGKEKDDKKKVGKESFHVTMESVGTGLSVDARISMRAERAMDVLAVAISKLVAGLLEGMPRELIAETAADFLSKLTMGIAKALDNSKKL